MIGELITVNGQLRRVVDRIPQHRVTYDAKGRATWKLTHYALVTEATPDSTNLDKHHQAVGKQTHHTAQIRHSGRSPMM